MLSSEPPRPGRVLGRYVLYDEIAAGGMATVHLGRLLGPVGFARTVAIKRLHPHVAKDPEFVSMFLDEARLAARIQHPNVVSTLDVVALEGELFLVMDYVKGESLSRIVRASRAQRARPSPRVVSGILAGVLYGLHAAHEARSERGQPLGIVHRDVSPQNVLVGIDGVARVLDFGVAKAARRAQSTRDGQLKGKFAYMAPEQLQAAKVDRRTDIFAASVVLWEALAGRRLFDADEPGQIMGQILSAPIPPPTKLVPMLTRAIDEVVLRGLARNPAERYPTAREMAIALEKAIPPAIPREVGDWVERMVGETLDRRAARVAEIESISAVHSTHPPPGSDLVSIPTLTDPAIRPPTPSLPTAPDAVPPGSLPGGRGVESGEMASAPSNVTGVTASPPTQQPIHASRSNALIVGVALGSAAIAGLVVAAAAGWRGAPRQPPAGPGGAPAVPSETAIVAPSPPAASLAAPAAAASSAAEVDLDEARPPASASSRPHGPAGPAPSGAAAQARPGRRGCDPPYTVDEKGMKHFKPQCL